ncbi:MAG: HEPN domain-containing protein [Prevotella sp.]|nr:HEPN domain-containing protein [Prevotella sp.]
MKETLDEQSRQELIRYRLERADEAMDEARLLFDASHYNAAVNRMYYACFYATQALLLKHHIAAATHAGVKTMLGLHFVSKGILPVVHGRTFNTLFEKRHSSDYEAFAYCDRDMVNDLLPLALSYIEALKELVNQSKK